MNSITKLVTITLALTAAATFYVLVSVADTFCEAKTGFRCNEAHYASDPQTGEIYWTGSGDWEGFWDRVNQGKAND